MFVRRALLLAVTLLASYASAARAAPSVTSTQLLRIASLSLVHRHPGQVARWLRSQPPVRSAAIGRDGETLTVAFRDGRVVTIVPRGLPSFSLPSHLPAFRPRLHLQSGSHAPRAAVFEPFATQLMLGPTAGDTVAAELRSVGFQVDQLFNSAVTLDTMKDLSQYNVVFMETHAGVNQLGEGVLVTGQLADDQTESVVSPDYSVMTTMVAGDTHLYYGILSRFILEHGRFPPHALLFISACFVITSTAFWNAFSQQGVGAMVGWDNWASSGDGQAAADEFFASLARGGTVDQAMNTLEADGRDVSHDPDNGATAHLSYLGDGSLTLAEVEGQGQPLPPAAHRNPRYGPR